MLMIAKHEKLQSDWQDSTPERPREMPSILPFVRFAFRTLGRLFPGKASDIALRLFMTPITRAKHRVSDPILESARIFEVLYGKQMLKCYEWGNGDKTVLLVHGWESRGTAMRSFVPLLTQLGYKVVAFDGPAHGNSDGKRTNIHQFGGSVRAVINQIGEVHALISHSFGGASANYAFSFLDNDIHINKIVMIAVPASIKRVYLNAVKTLGLPPNVASRFRKKMEGIANRSLEEIDHPDTLNRIKVDDVLVVHDRKDQVVPFQSAEEFINNWDKARLLETNGYGHFRLMKNPDVIKAVGEFVNS
ncbi:MAG: alpha/beta hydrolase [Bacteroidetes bacterium]|nr:alpha/beta hydrolase [Bacteroidota bacterium]